MSTNIRISTKQQSTIIDNETWRHVQRWGIHFDQIHSEVVPVAWAVKVQETVLLLLETIHLVTTIHSRKSWSNPNRHFHHREDDEGGT